MNTTEAKAANETKVTYFYQIMKYSSEANEFIEIAMLPYDLKNYCEFVKDLVELSEIYNYSYVLNKITLSESKETAIHSTSTINMK